MYNLSFVPGASLFPPPLGRHARACSRGSHTVRRPAELTKSGAASMGLECRATDRGDGKLDSGGRGEVSEKVQDERTGGEPINRGWSSDQTGPPCSRLPFIPGSDESGGRHSALIVAVQSTCSHMQKASCKVRLQ